MTTHAVLLVEDNDELREAISDTLTAAGHAVTAVADGPSALDVLKSTAAVSLVLTDVKLPGMSGIDLLGRIVARSPHLPVIIITAFGTIGDAVSAMRAGALDYLVKPLVPDLLLSRVAAVPRDCMAADGGPVAEDGATRSLLEMARRVAATDLSVMISGESGTGKEVVAQFIRRCSPRADGPFIAINCAAIPDNMLEAILFGYEKGAFTGALASTPGKFELAHRGTLLLDEISEMNLGLQAKLLRVLQEREVERIGGRRTMELDVRVLATTNRNLEAEVAEGRFRQDLYFRLNVFPIRVPPLRERPGDIVPLARYLLAKHGRATGRGGVSLTADAEQYLRGHSWPGNVRELDNLLQRALVLHHRDALEASDLMMLSATIPDCAKLPESTSRADGSLSADLKVREQQRILEVLASESGCRKNAAARLGISARTLRYKLAEMRRHGLAVPG
jgi:two-component system response regulator FlrC